MSEYHHEKRTGYEAGGYQETSSSGQNQQGQQRYQPTGNSGGSQPRKWNNAYGGKPSGQSGGGRRFGGGFGGARDQAPRDFSVDPPELYRPYAATSNQGTFEGKPVVAEIIEVRDMLYKNGYMVRTSVMDNTLDRIFGDTKRAEIILPWKEFGKHESKLTFTVEEAKWFASKMHPAYDRVPDVVKTFLAKDLRLICGQNMKSLVQFLLVHSDDGCESTATKTRDTGNVGHIINVADELRIPIFNFGKPNVKERLMKHLRIQPEVTQV